MSEDLVNYTVDEAAIAWLTLCRPAKLNAVTDDMAAQLVAALNRFDNDDAARVAVLSGEGRAFCSGADVKARHMRSKEEMAHLPTPGGRLDMYAPLYESVHYKPVVAAVHGYALGAGMRLALECDLIVADETAVFEVTEVARGLHGTAVWRLVRDRCGDGLANQLALTARRCDASEAHQRGLVDLLTPAGEHRDAAGALARSIAENPAGAVGAVARSARILRDEHRRWARRMTENDRLHLSPEFAERTRAFVDRAR